MVRSIPTYSSVVIETPENISFEYELAGPGTRMVAYLVDFLIVFTGISILSAGYVYLSYATEDLTGFKPLNDIANAIVGAIVALIFPLGGYWTTFEMIWSGQSPGKKLMGIRVIQENGLPVSFPALLIRNVFRLADAFFPFQFAVGFFMLTFSKNTQRLGDIVAGTIVVKEKKALDADRYKWSHKPIVPQEYKIRLRLTEKEFDFLIEYLGIWRDLNISDRNRISQKVIAAIIKGNPLKDDPIFKALLEKFEAAPEEAKFKPAERIISEILRFYLVQES